MVLPGRVLRGHRGSVLTLYAMGGLLLSGGRDNVIRIWVCALPRLCPHHASPLTASCRSMCLQSPQTCQASSLYVAC